jgi:hypothetical protein
VSSLGEDGGVDVVRVADQEGARQQCEHATEQPRRLAIAADAELRCRHLGRKIEPLRSAEPASASDIGHGPLHPAADGKLTETAAWIRGLAIQGIAQQAAVPWPRHPALSQSSAPSSQGSAARFNVEPLPRYVSISFVTASRVGRWRRYGDPMELGQGANHVILRASALCSAPLSAIAGRRVLRLTVMHYQSDCPYGHAAGASLFALN